MRPSRTSSRLCLCAALVFFFSLSLLCSAGAIDDTSVHRRRVSLDFDWRFHLGDVQGGEAFEYNDEDWRRLDVPHDWSIEGPYREDNPAGQAGGYLPTGIGWYRKELPWQDSWTSQRVIIQFDGVYMNSDVWINGRHVGKRPYGYISFWYDITEFLQKGSNLIAVRVDHSKAPSGRWYTGSGIYRHVWLTVVDPIHIPTWGTFVRTTSVTEESATVELTTEIENHTHEPQRAKLQTAIFDEQDRPVARRSSPVLIAPGETGSIEQSLLVKQPRLWSPGSPALYRVENTVLVAGEVRDSYETTLGIRDLKFTVDRGFLLNGKPLEIRGACMHHDAGPVGAAVPEDVLRRRLLLLKDMGANAVRTAHNPFAPEFYDLTDELGLMVMDEAFDGWMKAKAEFDYGIYFDEWWQRDLNDFIRRDRNHPSIIMWSIGNEVPGWKPPDQKRLVDFVKQLDPTRPVTQGRGYRGPHIDVAGFNGHGEYMKAIEKYHEQNPDQPVIGTEMTHSTHTRGVYRTKTKYRTRDNPAPWEAAKDGGKKKWEKMKDRVFPIPDLADPEVFPEANPRYHSSYDNSFVRMNIANEIRLANRLPYLLGTFRWTAFDYLGESFGWPARTENFGVMDLAGFPKDTYYLYQSQWTTKPMIHLLPHWTHPGKEGIEIPVVVYTNQPSAELMLNGKSLGEQRMGDDMRIVWQVPYQPGTLEAIARDGSAVKARKRIQTAGEPTAITLSVDRPEVTANRRDVIHVEVTIVDKQGVPVPDANHRVEFDLSGPAKIIGVENGDILDLSPHQVDYRKAFQGKCLVLVQVTEAPGRIELTTKSPRLQSASVSIESRANPPKEDLRTVRK